MKSNTLEFDCGRGGFPRFLMLEFSCQNKIADISAMVKATRKYKFGLELAINWTNLIIYQYFEKLCFKALIDKKPFFRHTVFFSSSYAKS